jgi:hypothetical protein
MPRTHNIRSMLTEGRIPLSIGRTGEVAALVFSHPRRANQLIECLWDSDPGVAFRAADALEEVTRDLPTVLVPFAEPLLGLLDEATQNKLRWNLALIVPRLALSRQQCQRAADTLQTYLEDPSSIVKTCALQGLADLTVQDSSLLPVVLDLLRIHSRSGTPAMRARGRKLLQQLDSRESKAFAELFGFRTLRKGIPLRNALQPHGPSQYRNGKNPERE